jgi:SAM-dependent methyltransferase
MNLLKAYIKKQSFNPDIAGVFINPFFIARRNLYVNIREYATELSGKILDVGCGKKPYQHLFNKATQYIGMDIDNPGHDHSTENIDVYYDGKVFPFQDRSFDAVLTNQVFEHVFNPEDFMKEIFRVLKPGGKLLITVPFVWDEHEQPNDFGRYSSFGLSHVLEKNGFSILSFRKSTKGFAAIAQLTTGYIFKLFYSKSKIVNGVGTLAMSPISIVLLLISVIAPTSSDIYLDNVVLAQKNQ